MKRHQPRFRGRNRREDPQATSIAGQSVAARAPETQVSLSSEQSQPLPETGDRIRQSKNRRNRISTPKIPDVHNPRSTQSSQPMEVSRMPRQERQSRSAPKQATDADLTNRIVAELRRGYECMVCMSQIRVTQAIWTCSTCWALFHLKCTHEWIKRNSPTSRLPGSKWEWRCPGCQYVYIESELPAYKCFCGRLDNPMSSRQYTAHSCGESCSRKRPGCEHPCVLSCHPGPCPPCTALLPRSGCFSHSGQVPEKAYVRCGDPSSQPHSCGRPCDRPLPCGIHRCTRTCHQGPCGKCEEVTGQKPCHCGLSSQPIACSDSSLISSGWSCEARCSKMFSCGIHPCTRKCHEGSCGPCPDDPIIRGNNCECMKTVLAESFPFRTKCTDPVPTCEKICEKINSCGIHKCQNTCHHGACRPCEVQVVQTCSCGRSKRAIACNRIAISDEYRCDQICRTIKSCSKHRCDIVCCAQYGRKDFAAETHLCLQVCNKPLNCGFHNCDEICHLGKCKPCRVVIREPLTCGCGSQVIRPPVACGTPVPVCYNTCNKPLANCEHKCLSTCHSGPCSPCPVLVPKMCAGGHRALPAVPCYVESVSCGSKCGKALECGRHKCLRTCHAGSCLSESETCMQPCKAGREFCEHDCGIECHDGPCRSEEPCRARIIVSCPCGLRTDDSSCRSCASNPHPAPPQIQCTMECQIAQRQACLRQAFKPEDVDLSEAEQYSGDFVTQAEKYDKFARIIDSMLLDASENRTRMLHLPTTDLPRRWLTLEYAQVHYRFDAEVVREGDGLHVVVNFVPGQTRTPKPTLTAMLDMVPSQTLKYTIDFNAEGPKIHLYDVARGYGRVTAERIHRTLKEFLGTYRTRRGEGFDMFIDFVDANKAVAAYRKLRSMRELEQCRLVNVPIFDGEATKDICESSSPSSIN